MPYSEQVSESWLDRQARYLEATIYASLAKMNREHKRSVHDEPDCMNPYCRYMEPHHHGFACDWTCKECCGVCHPDCPAYSNTISDFITARMEQRHRSSHKPVDFG